MVFPLWGLVEEFSQPHNFACGTNSIGVILNQTINMRKDISLIMSFFSYTIVKIRPIWHILCTVTIIIMIFGTHTGSALASETTLELWDFPRWLEPGETTDRFTWTERKAKEFEKLHPQVKVNLTKLTWQRGAEKLKIAALGGSNPDVAPGTVPLIFINEGLIEPIDNYLDENDIKDYFPGALNAFKVEDKIFGWPFYMSGQLLFANKDLFARAEVALPTDGRWTPEEFQQKMQQLKKFFHNETVDGTSLTEKGYFPLGLYFQRNETANLPFLMCKGGNFFNQSGEFMGQEPEMTSGINWVKSLIDDRIAPVDSGGRISTDIWSAFAQNHRIAVAAFGLWGIQGLIKRFPMNFEVVHFPAAQGKPSGSFIGTSGFYVFKNKDSKRVEYAMKLAKFLTNAANQKDLAHHTQFPTRRSTGNIYEGDRHMTRALEILQEGQTVLADNRWPQIDEVLQVGLQQTLLGRSTPTEAMNRVKEQTQRIMSSQRGSIREDITKTSLLGKILTAIAIIALIFALLSRQPYLVMIVPAIGIIGLFLFQPLIEALLLAFRNYKLGEVGGYTFDNFVRAFTDDAFRQACFNTILYSAVVVPANVFTALIVASLINSMRGKNKSFFRAAYYLPGVASVVVLSMVWRWMFNTEAGLFNSMLQWFGMQPVGWLTNPNVAFWSIIMTGVLKSPGGAILIYLASMDNIPDSLYESAELEGASSTQKWWHITVPLLGHTTAFLLITGAIAALQVFAQVLMLTDGGPEYSTTVVVHRIYTAAFRDFDFGISSAMALILFVAIMIVTLVQRRYISQEVEYLA